MLSQYLSDKRIVNNVLGLDEIISFENKNVKIMMGQTFDSGQPLDMMKYSLFIMGLQDILSTTNNIESIWLLADHFITDINKDAEKNEIDKQCDARINYLTLINEKYNGKINFIKSSELSKKEKYQEAVKTLQEKFDSDENFRNKLLESIPKDKRGDKDSVKYPIEELATIKSLDADVKIGPIYEKKYDIPAREMFEILNFKKYSAVYLQNCYLLGNPILNEDIKNEIETFGVLPYKKNSKGLGDYRIDPINDSLEKVKELIYSTKDERALIDIVLIGELARKRLFLSEILSGNLKDDAFDSYKNFIFPLK